MVQPEPKPPSDRADRDAQGDRNLAVRQALEEGKNDDLPFSGVQPGQRAVKRMSLKGRRQLSP